MKQSMNERIAAVLGAHPELAASFYHAASEIADDFEDYGGALQANDNGEYDAGTAIQRLRAVREEVVIKLRLASTGPPR
jgi:hypothetical protein